VTTLKPALETPAQSDDIVRKAVEAFLAAARNPVVIEAGEDPIALSGENFVLSDGIRHLTLECWNARRNLTRRIAGVRNQKPGMLELATEQLWGRRGALLLVDLAHPAQGRAELRSGRLKYREQFRLSLRRRFPDWKLAELSAEADLEHSLSPAYPRALLRKGTQAWAAIGAAEDAIDADGALSFGLIWLDYLRRRETRLHVGGLALFLPVGSEVATCHRVRHLDSRMARYAVFVYGADGADEAVDPGGYTNFATRLEVFREPVDAGDREAASWLERLAAIGGVDLVARPDGDISLRVRGLEFAHTSGRELRFGLDRKHVAGPTTLPEVEDLARGIARLRNAAASDRTNPLYTRYPEAWLESQVRAHLRTVDATLREAPVYEQAPQFAAGHRGVLDLLAVDDTGRLAVIEIKASADIHLPLQALDYWMRVKWHLERGEFAGRGYFPGVALRPEAPRLLLVAPALEFHPSNETILRYFSSDIQIDRTGVNSEWKQDLRVMFRWPRGPEP
jgi:hypothetical protein